MAITIVTRASKGSALNATEFDANLTNLAAAIENLTTGHDHDGTDSKKIIAANIINTPAGNIAATDVQTALNELDTEKAPTATPTFTGDATIPTINLTGGQIKFPATQNASSDPNTFDDYEEGTWTVELYDEASGGNKSSTSTTGYYTKKGREVTAAFFIPNVNTSGMTSGNVMYFTLPFTAGIATCGSASLEGVAFAGTTTYAVAMVLASGARGCLRNCGNACGAVPIYVSCFISGSSDIEMITVTYFI